MVHGIDMGMQCEGLSDGYTAGVLCLYNTGMKQLLMYLREKTLQELKTMSFAFRILW